MPTSVEPLENPARQKEDATEEPSSEGLGALVTSPLDDYNARLEFFRESVGTNVFEGKWDQVRAGAMSLINDDNFARTDLWTRIFIVYAAGVSANALGDKKTLQEMFELAERQIKDATNNLKQGESPNYHQKHLQRLEGLATGKVAFSPEVVYSPLRLPPNEFHWCKATCVPQPIRKLTQDIMEVLKNTGADSGVVIYGDRVVPFTDGDEEKTVFYSPGCPERSSMTSNTKSFAAVVAFKMMEDGLINLDAKVSDLMPEWNWGKDGDNRGDITIRDLLTHSSGLPGDSPQFPDVTKSCLRYIPKGKIGDFLYSNIGVQLLSPILSKALKESGTGTLEGYIQTKILDPLGMSRTLMNKDNEGTVLLYANMDSTCLDFARFGLLIKNKGTWQGAQLLESKTVEELLRPSAANPAMSHLWWLGYAPVSDPRPAGVSADQPILISAIGALHNNMYIVPELDLVVVRTQEIGPHREEAHKKIMDLLTEAVLQHRKS